MSPELRQRLETTLGDTVQRLQPLAGGCLAEATRVDLVDGRQVVVKRMAPMAQPSEMPAPTLLDEAFMLTTLQRSGAVPVPNVLHAEEDLLVRQHHIQGRPARRVCWT